MAGFCKIIVAGAHLGRDASSRFTPTGKQVVQFSAAHNRKYTGSDGEQVKETTWLSCQVWPVSEAQGNFFMSSLQKGRKVSFEGRLAINPETGGPRTWERPDGGVSTAYEVVVNPLTLDISNNGLSNGFPPGEGPLAKEEEVPF